MQTVRDPAELPAVLDVLLGGSFGTLDVLFDPDAGVLSVSLACPASEEPPLLVRNLGWLFRRWRVPLRESVLRIHQAGDHRIHRGAWRLTALGFQDGVVSVFSGAVPAVRVRVDGLELSVEQRPTIVGERIESCTLGFLRRSVLRRSE